MTRTTPSTTANTRSTTTDGTLNSNPCFRSSSNNKNNNNYTTATPTSTRSRSYILLLLRGPIIVFAVIISLLFPYIQEYCTVWVFMHFTIAIVGLLWICHDLKIIIESKTRYILNFLLNKIILDDVLKVIYDPIDGIWACMVGTFVGASTIYGFNMNNEQKIELMQSSFYFLRNKYEAHTVLLEPGGCKKLLPNEVQQWLSTGAEAGAARTTSTSMSTTINNNNNEEEIQINNNNNNNNNNATTSIDPYTNNNGPYSPLSPSSYTSDCDVADIDDCDDDEDDDDECRNYLDIFKEEEEEEEEYDDNDDDLITSARELQHQQRTKTAAAAAATTTCSSRSKSNSSSNQQTDDNNNNNNNNSKNNSKNNVAVFCKILQKMILQKLQPCAESLQQSQSKIENVGITSAMIAIGIQYIAFRQRRQQQQRQHQHQRSYYNNNMTFPFPSSSLLGSIFCASIATMSFGTILSKEVILGNIYNKQTMQRSCYDITSRIVNRLKGQAKQIITIPKNKKERFIAAMFVLVLFCHNRRHRQVHRQGNHHHTTTTQ